MSSQAPPLTIVQPSHGTQGDLGSIGVVFKLWGSDTGGALSVVEHPSRSARLSRRTCTPGKMSPPS